MKTQKTVYVWGFDGPGIELGQELLLIGVEKEGYEKEQFSLVDAPEGYGGNVNPGIKRFHGWRGTTDGTSVYAYGLRRVISIRKAPKRQQGYGCVPICWAITVGPDLHPDLP